MKINRKGFMLAEVVIVAAVVSTVLISLYIALNRIASAYDTRNKYYDIDAMYAAMLINDSLDDSYADVDYYEEIDNSNKFIQFCEDNELFTSIKAYYVGNDVDALTELEAEMSGVDQYLVDYVEYLQNRIERGAYGHLIIVEIKKSNVNDVYYYTLVVERGSMYKGNG